MQVDSAAPTPAVQGASEATQAAPTQTQPQRASAVSVWLNRVFVVVILVAIPLLYWFGYIGVVWLNRIGIILNFCAGFMVAPELIGVSRLRKLEKRIKTISLTLAVKYLKAMATTHEVHANVDEYCAKLSHIWTGVLETSIARRKTTNLQSRVKVRIDYVIAFIILMANRIYNTASKPVSLIINRAEAVGVFLIDKLIRNIRLRETLLWWGIIFFIVGNLLQFISTF
jgi:hypothetical protein